jgi:hypothetical protein
MRSYVRACSWRFALNSTPSAFRARESVPRAATILVPCQLARMLAVYNEREFVRLGARSQVTDC